MGGGDESRRACRTSTALSRSKEVSGGADGPEGCEAFDLTSAAKKRPLGERLCGELRRGGGVGDRGRRSREARRTNKGMQDE